MSRTSNPFSLLPKSGRFHVLRNKRSEPVTVTSLEGGGSSDPLPRTLAHGEAIGVLRLQPGGQPSRCLHVGTTESSLPLEVRWGAR